MSTCAICVEITESPVCCVPCGHVYCRECIENWKKSQRTVSKCPECREKIQDVIAIFIKKHDSQEEKLLYQIGVLQSSIMDCNLVKAQLEKNLTEEHQQLTSQLEKNKKERDSFKDQRLQWSAEKKKLQEKAAENMKKKEDEVKLLYDKLEALETLLADSKRVKSKLEKNLRKSRNRISNYKEEQERLTEELVEQTNMNDSYKESQEQFINQVGTLKNVIATQKAEKQTLKDSQTFYSKKVQTLECDIDELEDEKHTLEDSVVLHCQKIRTLEYNIEKLTAEKQSLADSVSMYSLKNRTCENNIKQLRAGKQFLEESVAFYSEIVKTYGYSIKTIGGEKQTLKDLLFDYEEEARTYKYEIDELKDEKQILEDRWLVKVLRTTDSMIPMLNEFATRMVEFAKKIVKLFCFICLLGLVLVITDATLYEIYVNDKSRLK